MIKILRGLIGWSNFRPGVEFYRWDDKIIPRHSSKWGDLLVFEEGMKEFEGCPVICIILPRNASPNGVREIESLLETAIRFRESPKVTPSHPTPSFSDPKDCE